MAKPLNRTAGAEWTHLPDCRGLSENGRCQWLKVPQCLGADCAYYRQSINQAAAWQRLNALSEEQQAHIALKYYGGSRPWAGHGKPSR